MNNDLRLVYQTWIESDKNTSEGARKLGIPQPTFWVKLQKAKEQLNAKDPVIAFWDVETSHIFSAHYGMWNININKYNILHDWFMVCGAWKFRGESKIHATSLLDDMEIFNQNRFDIRDLHINDYHVVKTLHDFLSKVDILVHHNGDKFDIKKFNARALYHGLPPIGHIQTVDTLKEARKHFALTSNSLDYLCEYLGVKGKIHNDRGLALEASLCKPEAIKKYVKYNKRDVFPSLEGVYNKLLPYMKSHPNMNLYIDHDVCPKCGSIDIVEEGYKHTRATVKVGIRCNSCGGVAEVSKSLKTVKVR